MVARTLVIGLDGYEISLAERMMSEGRLPHMAELKRRSACFDLDHGKAKYSGLAWEHISTGKTPEDLGRFSAVDFDTQSYRVRQRPTDASPILDRFTGTKAVVFDLPYCDLGSARNLWGLTNWGAHDPGVAPISNPPGLHSELRTRVGPYPAPDHIYGFVWPDPEKTRRACTALANAVRCRKNAARWLLGKRIPDWDLSLVVVSEAHSAIEMAWHGIDPDHVLSDHPSAEPAREGLYRIYKEIDALIGDFAEAFQDADIVLFAMHGMGSNNSDIPAMALLPELLYRQHFGSAYMRDGLWERNPHGQAAVAPDFSWHHAMEAAIPPLWDFRAPSEINLPVFDYIRERDYQEIEWMPAVRYQPFWPAMEIFAIPGFYDGRMRVNLAGREAHGTVSAEDYHSIRERTLALISECTDLATGEPICRDAVFASGNPFDLGASEADLEIHWNGTPTGLVHPRLGQIGPIPYRRPGGHTGDRGFAWFSGDNWTPGYGGLRDAFDIMPTIAMKFGEENAAASMSGEPIERGKVTIQQV